MYSTKIIKFFFGNKYKDHNLEMYFKERKQFADLMFSQAHYDNILQSSKKIEAANDAKLSINKNKREIMQNKIFSEFKIKTKFMKEKVKNNILVALVDVKTQLLKQYHSENVL